MVGISHDLSSFNNNISGIENPNQNITSSNITSQSNILKSFRGVGGTSALNQK